MAIDHTLATVYSNHLDQRMDVVDSMNTLRIDVEPFIE